MINKDTRLATGGRFKSEMFSCRYLEKATPEEREAYALDKIAQLASAGELVDLLDHLCKDAITAGAFFRVRAEKIDKLDPQDVIKHIEEQETKLAEISTGIQLAYRRAYQQYLHNKNNNNLN